MSDLLSWSPPATPAEDELPGALRALAMPGVAWVHVPRTLRPEVALAATAAVAQGVRPYEGVIDDVGGLELVASGIPEVEHRAALVSELARAVATFRRFSRARRPAVTFGIVATDQCRKFHVDYVALRLVTTLHGPGTEWLPEAGAERAALNRLDEDVERANREIVKDPSLVRRCASGDWLFMKGEGWPGQAGAGAVHRSPPIERTGERRLVLTLTLPRSRRATGRPGIGSDGGSRAMGAAAPRDPSHSGWRNA